jgi:hypothetical protein
MFHPAVSGTRPRTIRLVGGPLVLTDPATTRITGPGARWLTVRGGGRGPVFEVRGGSLARSGLTIRGGRARHARGGRLLNDRGTMSLARVAIRGNSARVGGGIFNDGTATLTDVTIAGNRARIGGLANLGTMTLDDVRLLGNTARVASGLFSGRSVRLLRRRSPARSRVMTHDHAFACLGRNYLIPRSGNEACQRRRHTWLYRRSWASGSVASSRRLATARHTVGHPPLRASVRRHRSAQLNSDGELRPPAGALNVTIFVHGPV